MDVQELSAKATARCGIRIEPHDAAFVLIALNQIVLEETIREINMQVDVRIAALTESIEKVERLAGKRLAQEIKASGTEMRREIQEDVKEAGWKARELILQISRSNCRPALIRWTAIGILGGILMFIAGVCFGWYVPFTSIAGLR